MKMMTVLASVMFAANFSVAAEVDTPVTNPINVKIVRLDYDVYEFKLFDSNGAVRLRIDRNGTYYVYRNSSETNSIQKPMTTEDFEKIMPLVRNASNRCPAHFTIVQPSFEIAKVSSPCDPMEFVQ